MTASPKAIFWRPDPAVEAARRLPGWRDFHRRCGLQGLFFDGIAPVSRAASAYTARAYRIARETGDLVSHTVAHGSGADVVAAVKAALDAAMAAAVAVAFADMAGLKVLLDAVEPVRTAPASVDELLGIVPPAPPAMNILELIG